MLVLPAISRNMEKTYFWQITYKKHTKNIPLFWLGGKSNWGEGTRVLDSEYDVVTEVDWAVLGNNVDGTTVLETEDDWVLETEDDWEEVVLCNDWEELGDDDKGLLEITQYEFS